MSGKGKLLGVALLLCIALDVLLTPVGLESRSASDVTTLGLAAGVLSLVGLVLAVSSLVLIFRKPRWGSTLAVLAGLLFVPGIAVDRAGLFHTNQLAPSGVVVVEISLLAAAVVVMALGFGARRGVAHSTN
jgi:uncharacterized membrane protein (DUF2068 family)